MGGNRSDFSLSEGWTQKPPPPCFLGNDSEADGRSSIGVTSFGDGAEAEADDVEPRGSSVAGYEAGVPAATDAAAECRDRRAWRIVKRVWIRAVRRYDEGQ